ncbi:8534_t:CDS:1 [Ambispora gerdemannii]|uniref:8534_t:CDS:1 n=1 Tax=Ambispora gerdemannii TaxID=144530 RepID=A0A9N9FAB1_9GLOM|nr:8534_t:CDS:1 [Ambispora gerdemannii]
MAFRANQLQRNIYQTQTFATPRNSNNKNLNDDIKRFELHPHYPILLKILDLRDKIYVFDDENEILIYAKNIVNQASNITFDFDEQLDLEFFALLSSLTQNVAEICNQQVKTTNHLIEIHSKLVEQTTSLYYENKSITHDILATPITIKTLDTTKKTRDRIDPEATLWLIKYLLDNDFEKPHKKYRSLLSQWTNIPEEDIDGWYKRTNHNYLKEKVDKKSRDGLIDRALKYGRQIGKARITKLNNGAFLNSTGADREGRNRAKRARLKANNRISHS